MAAKRQGGFTLIELLIVIGLLGALATLVIPSLSVRRDDVYRNSIVPSEMATIRDAFNRFVADCAPTREDFERILTESDERKRLRILLDAPTGSYDFPAAWDPVRQRGWNGPYFADGNRWVSSSNRSSPFYRTMIGDPFYDPSEEEDETKAVKHCYGLYRTARDNATEKYDLYLRFFGMDGMDNKDANRNPGKEEDRGDNIFLLLIPDIPEA